MLLRTSCHCLFIACALSLTSCAGMANPLGMVTRMLQSVGRTARIIGENDAQKPMRFEQGEIERSRMGMEPGLEPKAPEPAPVETIAQVR